MNKRKKIILGAFDSLSAHLSSNTSIDYIWASSFILSTIFGNKDIGIMKINTILPMLNAIIKSSQKPVILDFDIGGRNFPELKRNLSVIKNINLGGVCIEDEKWPKVNAMIFKKKSNLIRSEIMCKKLNIARKVLGKNFLIIARTHSFIEDEPINILQEKLNQYTMSGANVLCIHYTGTNWRKYRKMLSLIKIHLPLLLILSKQEKIPKLDKYDNMIEYILYPNQLYRIAIGSIEKLISLQKDISNEFRCSNVKIISPDKIFKLIDTINTNHE